MGKPHGQPSPSTEQEAGLFGLLICLCLKCVVYINCCVKISEELCWASASALQSSPKWSALPSCFPKIKDPKLYSKVYGSSHLLQLCSPDLGPMNWSLFLIQPSSPNYIPPLQQKALTSVLWNKVVLFFCVCISISRCLSFGRRVAALSICLWMLQECPLQPCPAAG